MVINPHLELRLGKADDGIQSVTVQAPVKGDSLKVSTIDRAGDSELFEFLVLHSATRGAFGTAGVTPRVGDRLAEIGFLVSDDQVSAPVLFACDTGALPRDLVPVRARHRHVEPQGPLVVNPTFQLLPEGPTREMRGRFDLANPFRTDRVWFSIADGVASPTFYSAAEADRAVLAHLTPRAPAPAALPAPLRAALVEAGALQSAASVEAHDQSRRQQVEHDRATLQARRWVLLEEVIPPAQIASLRRYYRDLIGEGFIRFADPEWPNRFFASREPLTYFFQQQLTDLISDIAGEPLKPSFSFLASYRPGAELKPHRDREQCYYAMSVLLDHGQPDDVSNWPIYMQAPGEKSGEAVRAALGDGVLYFGEEVVHYRHPLTDGYSTLWFLFWVPQDFAGPLD